MSCVLPCCGVAIFFPARSSILLIPEPFRATMSTPFEAAPASTRIPRPAVRALPVRTGPGPDVAHVNFPSEQGFEKRWPRVEQKRLQRAGACRGKLSRRHAHHRLGMREVREIPQSHFSRWLVPGAASLPHPSDETSPATKINPEHRSTATFEKSVRIFIVPQSPYRIPVGGQGHPAANRCRCPSIWLQCLKQIQEISCLHHFPE